ncbi:L-aspartate oxidase [Fodinisporobacter ferrooxydans]|uniref:L-aspartate oxidase n=1 Tax=Fodinisporobacter ferrooxydans TaxID=2901836 RepID=A0ABY4CFZ3_9BACL|nr:L-aspartate oxidase [Alicyclobacillaceae bacterium MYW30-H2]
MQIVNNMECIVIGSGIAGLTLSILASRHGRVALVTKGPLVQSNSYLAQGGIATALSDQDNPCLHAEDTLQTGQGLCDAKTVQIFAEQALETIEFLQKLGVHFDRDQNGVLALGKEGAHSRNRIIHAGGDATGRIIIETLLTHVQNNPNIEIFEQTTITDLWIDDGECKGAFGIDSAGASIGFGGGKVVLASGGLGQIYQFTTNAAGATGDGYALAYDAGAVLRDMEFVQFHPTALYTGKDGGSLPLISEAVRGEGARLVNSDGERFMHRYHEWGELAARDIVARSIYSEMNAGKRVFLDARHIPHFSRRFPTIDQICRSYGIDASQDHIPVVPAAHYTMGGIQTDDRGMTNIPGLYAIGEAASSGFHGANRLASNSLLEGLIMAERVIQHIVSVPTRFTQDVHTQKFRRELEQREAGRSVATMDVNPDAMRRLQQFMWTHAGIFRTETLLQKAREQLESWRRQSVRGSSEYRIVTTAWLVVSAALWRKESRGAHFRNDYPQMRQEYQMHSIQQCHMSQPVMK